MSTLSLVEQKLKFLNEISVIQAKLFRPGIEVEFPDEAQKIQFKKSRLLWTIYVQTVEIDIATVLVAELEENKSDFEAGIESINEKIQEVDDTVDFLNLLGRVIEIIGRIINLKI